MKLVYVFPIALITLFGCGGTASNDPKTPVQNESEQILATSDDKGDGTQNVQPEKPLSTKDYQEFYDNGNLKIEGDYDENDARHGLWNSYYENGLKWSESFYAHGLKSGHSITFYPNGKVRYVGEYKNDAKVGHWQFYDEEGTLISEENYSE